MGLSEQATYVDTPQLAAHKEGLPAPLPFAEGGFARVDTGYKTGTDILSEA
jgi:hypothetical protein